MNSVKHLIFPSQNRLKQLLINSTSFQRLVLFHRFPYASPNSIQCQKSIVHDHQHNEKGKQRKTLLSQKRHISSECLVLDWSGPWQHLYNGGRGEREPDVPSSSRAGAGAVSSPQLSEREVQSSHTQALFSLLVASIFVPIRSWNVTSCQFLFFVVKTRRKVER